MKLYQSLEYHIDNRIAFLTLNRPELGNTLDEVLMVELKDAFMAAEQDPQVKVMILRGKGTSFCLGLDPEHLLKAQGYTLDQNLAEASTLAQLYLNVYRSTKVVIAQVEGDALGAGAGLVTVCDFSFLSDGIRLGYPEVKLGRVPALMMPFLIRKVGETRAKQLMLGGGMIDAHEAFRLNLVTGVFPSEQIKDKVEGLAQEICQQNSAASLQLTKKMLADIQDFPLENAIKFAARLSARARNTEEYLRGLKAQLDGKEVDW